MARSGDLRQRIEHLAERTQDELLDASRQFADGITRETGRLVPPISQDVQRVVDHAFDFAERVLKGQRKMVSDLVKTVNEESGRAAGRGRRVVGGISKKAPAKKAAAKKAPAKKVPAAKKAAATRVQTKRVAGAKSAPRKRVATKAVTQ